MRQIEGELLANPRLPSGTATERFAGQDLPDLFPDMHEIPAAALRPRTPMPGTANRRAIVFTGDALVKQTSAIVRFIRRSVRSDPDTLWQFVLKAEWEEPLDVIDAMVDAVQERPLNQLDRQGAAELTGRLASRRVFLLLREGRDYDPAWVDAAEETLRKAFV
jgi:hypothetical protein